MSAFEYKSTVPENDKAEYVSYDVIDIIINDTDDRALVANSVCIHADLEVQQAGARVVADGSTPVFFNARTGCHNLFESCSVLTGQQGQLEVNNSYARYVSMVECATKDNESRFNSSDICELKCNSQELALGYCKGNITNSSGVTKIVDDKSFSMNPVCCLSKMSADLPFSKTGFIKLSLSCARVNSALYYGKNDTPDMKYILRNVRCTYQTTAANPSAPVLMRSIMSFTQNIQSANSSVIAKIPGSADSVSCVFQESDVATDPKKDSQRLARIQRMREISFQFNDASNTFITYPITDLGAMTEMFIKSVQKTGKNSANSKHWKGNDGFGIGLDFGAFVDLSNQKFVINIDTDNGVNATKKYLMNCFFSSLITL